MFASGIKLPLLRKILTIVSSYDEFMTTQQVCEKFIKGWTQSSQLSFIEHFRNNQNISSELQLTLSESLGDKPNLYICHTWSDQFTSLIHSIEDFCDKLDKDSVDQQAIVIWLDIFCVNQWNHQDVHSIVLPSLPEQLTNIGRTLVVLPVVNSGSSLFTRTWCLWEIFLTSFQLLEFDVTGSKEDLDIFRHNLRSTIGSQQCFVDLLSSTATNEQDRKEIFLYIEQFYEKYHLNSQNPPPFSSSSAEWFNQSIHATLVDWEENQQAVAVAETEMKKIEGEREGEEDGEKVISDQFESLSIENKTLSSPPSSESENGKAKSVDNKEQSNQYEGTLIEMGSETLIMFTCPYEECQGTITVAPNQVNCGVFRHGVYKTTGRPVGAHLSREKCLELIKQNKVYGCVQPFRIRKFLKQTSSPTSPSPPSNSTQPQQEPEQEGQQEPGKAEKLTKKQKKQQKQQHGQGQGHIQKREYHYFIEKCGYI